jgi:hypothetical protein
MASKAELIKQAYNHVYTDTAEFTRDFAAEFSLGNMGASVDQHLYSLPAHPHHAFRRAWNTYCDFASAEGHDFSDEEDYWRREAPRYIAALQQAGLPLSMANAQAVKLPPVKKSKKKR